ncbi:hypothetical protein DEW08_15265 [Azospirillum thermophilum]|uniref:NERD domain-containing protein n=2 Tax=Azospirillum thermophilum TaxID=2202148 RepID=A0A2S2CSF4_9PROT|nr:hypothetical protein DEW08_15265 [Azospirillum thermophilum]
MILKEPDRPTGNDRFSRAGHKAEEQMAFYLRRVFGDRRDVVVLNGLRLVRGGDAAQIDHLVLSRFGVIIVESKSVSTRIQVNEHKEWSRFHDGDWHGMQSPIIQARLQADFLLKYLEAEVPAELRTRQGFRRPFTTLRCDILVAVSDQGIIGRPANPPLPELLKADQVTERILDLLTDQAGGGGLLGSLASRFKGWSQEQLSAVAGFLRERHSPLHPSDAPVRQPAPKPAQPATIMRPAQPATIMRPAQPAAATGPALPAVRMPVTFTVTPPLDGKAVPGPAAAVVHPAVPAGRPPVRRPFSSVAGTPTTQPPAAVPPTPPAPAACALPEKRCRHCGSSDVEVQRGYSFHLHCRACDGKSRLPLACDKPDCARIVRQEGNQLLAVCKPCGSSVPYAELTPARTQRGARAG